MSFLAPFVWKVKFYSPSGINQSKNAAHVRYIGTRPGADLGEIEIKEEEEISDEELPIDPDTAAGHVKYAHERPGSHGLFSAAGNPDLKAIQKELKEHQGVVWRMVLSLREEDAARLGMTTRESWENALRASVPEAAEKMGIGISNLRWVAAFHQEKGHPHVHLIIWEKNPYRTKGVLSKGERKEMKNVFLRQIYAEERTRLLQEKTALRDIIRDIAKGDTEKAVQLVKEIKSEVQDVELDLKASGIFKVGIAPKMYDDVIKEYAKQLDHLSRMMPGQGRVALKFMPEDVKHVARKIADSILNQPSFKVSLDRYMLSVHEMTSLHTLNSDRINQAKNKAYNDLRDRVANIVLRGAAKINQADRQRVFVQQRNSNVRTSVAKGVWNGVWKALEQVRIQSEAQSQMQERQAQQLKRQLQKGEKER